MHAFAISELFDVVSDREAAACFGGETLPVIFSLFNAARKLSALALSQHTPVLIVDTHTPMSAHYVAYALEAYWAPLSWCTIAPGCR